MSDIFISYMHKDNATLSGEPTSRGWVHFFNDALKMRLDMLLGRDARIWRDNKGMANGSLARGGVPTNAGLLTETLGTLGFTTGTSHGDYGPYGAGFSSYDSIHGFSPDFFRGVVRKLVFLYAARSTPLDHPDCLAAASAITTTAIRVQ